MYMAGEVYIYDSAQLERTLKEIRGKLMQQKKLATTVGRKDLIQRRIEQIDAVLCLAYFRHPRILNRAELIMLVKKDRNEYVEAMNRFCAINDYENQKEKYEGFLEKMQGEGLDNDELMLDNWEEMERFNAFRSMEAEYKRLKHEVDVRHNLLGMIHRPYGFFDKVWK